MPLLVESLFCASFREKKKPKPLIDSDLGFLFGRDYWTRTSDLAPPRRVRYQLR